MQGTQDDCVDAARAISAALDAIVLSHLHGDHFRCIPFPHAWMAISQPARKPAALRRSSGTAERITAAMEVSIRTPPRRNIAFPWSVTEIPVGKPTDILGLHRECRDDSFLGRAFGPFARERRKKDSRYSGDTQWTEALPVRCGQVPTCSFANARLRAELDRPHDLDHHSGGGLRTSRRGAS